MSKVNASLFLGLLVIATILVWITAGYLYLTQKQFQLSKKPKTTFFLTESEDVKGYSPYIGVSQRFVYHNPNFTFYYPKELTISTSKTSDLITFRNTQGLTVLTLAIKDKALPGKFKSQVKTAVGNVGLLDFSSEKDELVYQIGLGGKVLIFTGNTYGTTYPQSFFETIIGSLHVNPAL